MTAQPAQSPLTPALTALENAAALDPVVTVGTSIAETVAGNDTIRHLLQGRSAGHALHPALVQAPLGTWLSATLLDLLGDEDDRDAAQLLAGLGVLAAVPAALTGWAEYHDTEQRDRRTGVVHAAANGAGVVLQLGSWAARRSGRHTLGRALGLGGVALSGAAGYLGGHLAVARKVGSRDAAYVEPPSGSHRR